MPKHHNDFSYAREQIYQALTVVIYAREGKRLSLAQAYTHHLVRLLEEDVTQKIWAELSELARDLSTKTNSAIGSANASAWTMHHGKLNMHRERIASWLYQLSSEIGSPNK